MKNINWSMVASLLIVAALSTVASGLVSGVIVEQKMEYAIKEIKRIDAEGREMRGEVKEHRLKLEEVQMRQASAISKADTIHGGQDKRIERLENRK